MKKFETEVLVVGAGPVGMMTALQLAEKGISVKIIDQGWRAATHSYACALHPATLSLLDRCGMLKSVREAAWRIDSISLYDSCCRHADLKLSDLPHMLPCALTLPQSAFESLLERRLGDQFGIHVDWNHRVNSIALGKSGAVSCVDKLGQSAKGYIVPEWDWTVQKEMQVNSVFVVGADGHDSTVRRRLGIDYLVEGDPEMFAVFEFETETSPGNEVKVVIDNNLVSVLWPLSDNRARWSFQLDIKNSEEFPTKDRDTARLLRADIDEIKRNYAQGLARSRAPWFDGKIHDVVWSARICFQPGLAARFGALRGWLVGDAAHQTGPVGVQSLNAGLAEAEDLAAKLASVLRDSFPLRLLETYDKTHRHDWKKLLAATAAAKPAQEPQSDWFKNNAPRILGSLPATGEDLSKLAAKIGLTF
jgi:2-polyprenyl-6-methoxyphenol hydroxylase-like FAD-dependent oxidoreductase